MARRGGVMPGRAMCAAAVVLGIIAGTGNLAPSHAPAHGAHIPQVIQDHVPSLPRMVTGPGKYTPNVCHPDTEAPASQSQLNAWITQASRLLHRPYTAGERRIVLVVIDGESEGRVHAINCWDRNAVENHPTMGLMQDRDDTFMAHAPKPCRRLALIYDGPCNIAASTVYAIGRYGSLEAIPGVGEVAAGGDYHTGY
jgi:hypothetical protein